VGSIGAGGGAPGRGGERTDSAEERSQNVDQQTHLMKITKIEA
jgi:hypothetical protein